MTQYGTWVSYAGSARISLAVGLLATAGAIASTGTRLHLPVRATRSGRAAAIATVGAWAATIVAFLVCAHIYVRRYIHAYYLILSKAAPPDNIAPVTFTAVAVVFFVILTWVMAPSRTLLPGYHHAPSYRGNGAIARVPQGAGRTRGQGTAVS